MPEDRISPLNDSDVAWWRLNAYCGRLADFILDHIGEPYTAEECGRVLEIRSDVD